MNAWERYLWVFCGRIDALIMLHDTMMVDDEKFIEAVKEANRMKQDFLAKAFERIES